MSFGSLSSRASGRSSSASPPTTFKTPTQEEDAAEAMRFEILEPNNILLAEAPMSMEVWTSLAFSLGLEAKETRRSSPATQKLAQRSNKRKALSATNIIDNLNSFIESLTEPTAQLAQTSRKAFHHDAVPSVDALKNTTRRLPVPKPSITLGYRQQLFLASHDELHEGLINGPSGEPCDLQRISQPIAHNYWPFLVVEVSDDSILAARQASAIAGATCNNAMAMLAGAASDDPRSWNGPFTSSNHSARSFSLAVHEKSACLSTHHIESNEYHVSTVIANYRLNEPDDVACLAHRLHGIFVWARHNRLGELTAVLDQLSRKIHGSLPGVNLKSDPNDFDPAYLRDLKMRSPRRPDRMKVVLRAGLPSWLKT